MKNTTKIKILRWVERLLNYEQPIHIPYKEETRKIKEIRYSGHLYDWDAEHNLKESINIRILHELSKTGAIEYKKEKHPQGGYSISARLFYIDPLTTT